MSRKFLIIIGFIIVVLILVSVLFKLGVNADSLTVPNEQVLDLGLIKQSTLDIERQVLGIEGTDQERANAEKVILSSSDLRAKLEKREELFTELIKSNPAQAIELTLSSELRGLLPEELKSLVEERISVSGQYSIYHQDDFTGKSKPLERPVLINNQGVEYQLFGLNQQSLQTGQDVNLDVVKLNNLLAVNGLNINQVDASIKSFIKQEPVLVQKKKVLVILYNYDLDPKEPVSVDDVRKKIFTDTTSTKAFIEEASYGKLILEGRDRVDGDVIGYVQLPASGSKETICNYFNGLGQGRRAKDQLASSGVSLVGYDYFIFIPGNCIESEGGAYIDSNELFVGPDLANMSGFVAHEFGHNFGTMHANGLYCLSETGIAVSISSQCQSAEYLDPFDVMGRSLIFKYIRHYSAQAKENIFGWLNQRQIQTIRRNGTYAVESLSLKSDKVKAISIPKRTIPLNKSYNTHLNRYIVEFRQSLGFDQFGSADPILKGILVRLAQTNVECGDESGNNLHPGDRHTDLIAAKPVKISEAWQGDLLRQDQPLLLGETFYDAEDDLKIKLVSIEGNEAKVEVTQGQNQQRWSGIKGMTEHNINRQIINSGNDDNNLIFHAVSISGEHLTSYINSYKPCYMLDIPAGEWRIWASFKSINGPEKIVSLEADKDQVVNLTLRDNIAPTQPSELKVETWWGIDHESHSITFNPSTDVGWGIYGYEIEVLKNNQLVNTKVIQGYTQAIYKYGVNDQDGSVYSYRVRAIDNAIPPNYSAWSDYVSKSLADYTPPTKPTNLSAISTGKGSELKHLVSWNPVTDSGVINGYLVEQRGEGINRGDKWVQGASSVVFDHISLNIKDYTYRVRAVDSNGNSSEWTDYSSIQIADTIAPTVPVDIKITNKIDGQEVSWSPSTDSSGIKGYELRIVQEGLNEPVLVNSASADYFNRYELADGIKFSYEVRAFDTIEPPNYSDWSLKQSLNTIDRTPPPVPSQLTAANVNEDLQQVKWLDVVDLSGIANYIISQYQGTNLIVSKSTNENNITFSVNYGDLDYSYTVMARDKADPPNESVQSARFNLRSLPIVPPIAPTHLKGMVKKKGLGRTITLSWKDNSNNETNYEIWRYNPKGDSTGKLIALVDPSSQLYLDASVKKNQTYIYRVRGVKNKGNGNAIRTYSSWSNKINITTK